MTKTKAFTFEYAAGDHARVQSATGKLCCVLAGVVLAAEGTFFSLLALHLIPNLRGMYFCALGVLNIVVVVISFAAICFSVRGLCVRANRHELEILAIAVHLCLMIFNSLGAAIVFWGLGNDI